MRICCYHCIVAVLLSYEVRSFILKFFFVVLLYCCLVVKVRHWLCCYHGVVALLVS